MKFFYTKITIEIPEFKLTETNEWYKKYKIWKEIWAQVKLKNVSRAGGVYFFCIDNISDFPEDFRVVMNNKIFVPTQLPIEDNATNKLIFHATCSENKK